MPEFIKCSSMASANLSTPSLRFRCPTLVLTGDEDYGNSPAMSRAIAAEIPGAELVVPPVPRHMAMAESPDLFSAQLLRFFRGTDREPVIVYI